jgi:hypothetical protein
MNNMKITFLLIVIVIFTFSFGACNNTPTATTSAATIDYQMYFSVPRFNFFITPEIKNQEKYVKISYTKDWSLTYDARWLDVSPKEGLANETVLVTITTRNEPEKAGQYQTEIRVESKDHASYKTIPVTLNIVPDKQGQIYDIPVNFELNDIFSGATEYRNTTVKLGILPQGEQSREGLIYDAGDPCIIVSTEYNNNTDNDTILYLTASGYSENGTQTSWCLSSGPLVGLGAFDLPAHQTTTVSLWLSWTNSLSKIEVQGTVYTGEMLKPVPATPIPESEMVRIWFDEEWFVNNDMEPSPTEVRITFPRKWLETGKSDSFNGTGIELAVPRQMLLDDNESTNPDEITVLFPIDYFNGRRGVPVTSTVK